MLSSMLAVALAASHCLAAPNVQRPDDSIHEHRMVTSSAAEQVVRDYWTPERVANISHDDFSNPPFPVIPDNEKHLGAPFEADGAVPRTVGRLLYTEPSPEGWRDSSCTATILDSINEATIVTAAHCLKPNPIVSNITAWHKNVLFLPGFRDNIPQFNFTINRAFLPKGWIDGPAKPEDRYYNDRAFAVLNIDNEKKKRARAELGLGQKIQFENSATDYPVLYNLGYPRFAQGLGNDTQHIKGTPAFTGLRLAACYGKAEEWWRFPSNMAGMPCLMSGGCSGGPSLAEFDFAQGVGFVTTVNSIGDLDGTSGGNASQMLMFGSSVTDDVAKQLFGAAQAIEPHVD